MLRRRTLWFILGGIVLGAILIAALVLPAVLPGALGAVGFTATGVQLGSAAAAIQSAIGLVTAGSAFAMAQSVTMGGAIPLLWSLGAAVAGGMLGGAFGALSAWLTTIMAPYAVRMVRGVRTTVNRAVRGVGRLASWCVSPDDDILTMVSTNIVCSLQMLY
ncbi:hypothetical protein DAEQUDRAFT_87947 [Daedalea quercina L-15889]|uniref:Uncharacterized protein n=1 Tax=Daedalea quercina L-15889 TaxID=1314783 RepID=A0A165KZQ1_9APHY|nr:hypothetical protein DAEQUDRAFT_87947 [Daedalea quercina L-15889]